MNPEKETNRFVLAFDVLPEPAKEQLRVLVDNMTASNVAYLVGYMSALSENGVVPLNVSDQIICYLSQRSLDNTNYIKRSKP